MFILLNFFTTQNTIEIEEFLRKAKKRASAPAAGPKKNNCGSIFSLEGRNPSFETIQPGGSEP